jgi:hypothetical protein
MISIGLWYYCRAGDFGKGSGDDNFRAPVVQSALQLFVDNGLLGRSPPGCEAEYFSTEALKVWVDGLCSVPWPEQKWVIPTRAVTE